MSVRHINENKTYTDQYVRKTSVGGLAALVPLYNRILRYYFGAGGATDLNLPPPQLDDHRAPTDDSTTPRETPPYPGTEGKSLPRPGAAASPTLVEVSGNVPEAFKSLVRRSQKLLLSKLDVQLAERFNRFVSALNASASNEKLEELADELEDAYHDARTQS